jgi:tRNA A37 N6-isopentenylltransferase MiaA
MPYQHNKHYQRKSNQVDREFNPKEIPIERRSFQIEKRITVYMEYELTQEVADILHEYLGPETQNMRILAFAKALRYCDGKPENEQDRGG